VRPERASFWLVGATFGFAAGLSYVFTFAYALPVVVILFVISCLLARNLSFPSGALIGFGMSWLGFALWTELDCRWLHFLTDPPCQAGGVSTLVFGAILAVLGGAALGLGARRRWERELGVLPGARRAG
jgi:hypothetical protein